MDVILTIKAETIREWEAHKEAVWFYLEDVPINKKDFSISHTDRGFEIKTHEYTAIRAKEALKGLLDRGYVRINVQPIFDNPEIIPVKKRKPKTKKKEKIKISNIKIKSREDICVGKNNDRA